MKSLKTRIAGFVDDDEIVRFPPLECLRSRRKQWFANFVPIEPAYVTICWREQARNI
jgi:hypothetical protein